jgi:hypothetical protein
MPAPLPSRCPIHLHLLSHPLLALPVCVVLHAWDARRVPGQRTVQQRTNLDILRRRVQTSCDALHYPVLAAEVDAFLPYADMEAPVQYLERPHY